MAIIVLDQDHMEELDSVFDDFSKGMAEYSILERFVEEPTFTAELDRKHLLIVKDIVESALHHNGYYSSSLLSEILSKVDRALGVAGSSVDLRQTKRYEERRKEDFGDIEAAMHGHGIEIEDDDDDDDNDEPAEETQRSRGFPPNRPPVKEYPPVAFGNPSKEFFGFPNAEKAKLFLNILVLDYGIASAYRKGRKVFIDPDSIDKRIEIEARRLGGGQWNKLTRDSEY